jgi:GNAT superfamily N-acetyltransferase
VTPSAMLAASGGTSSRVELAKRPQVSSAHDPDGMPRREPGLQRRLHAQLRIPAARRELRVQLGPYADRRAALQDAVAELGHLRHDRRRRTPFAFGEARRGDRRAAARALTVPGAAIDARWPSAGRDGGPTGCYEGVMEPPGTWAELEAHEASAWAACVAEVARDDDPLMGSVDVVGGLKLPALAALDELLFNRVVGLGTIAPVTDALLDRISASYSERDQTSYALELHSGVDLSGLVPRLRARGLTDSGVRLAKCWRRSALAPTADAAGASRLGPEDAAAIARVNLRAWSAPDILARWFAAPATAAGFRCYGVRVGDELVATGSMYVSDGLAWLGFGATLPEHRGRGLQSALLARRVHEAAALGCRWVHTETNSHAPERHNPSLSNIIRAGFFNPYERHWWVPGPAPGR